MSFFIGGMGTGALLTFAALAAVAAGAIIALIAIALVVVGARAERKDEEEK